MTLMTLLIQYLHAAENCDQRTNNINHCVLKDYLLAILTHGKRNKKVNKIEIT